MQAVLKAAGNKTGRSVAMTLRPAAIGPTSKDAMKLRYDRF